MNNFFSLFSCCLPVKGFMRSTICDLQRDSYMFIPNKLYELITDQNNVIDINQIKNSDTSYILNWLDKIVEEEFGFFCSDKEEIKKFESIDLTYREPKPITNSIIDIDSESRHNFKSIFSQLNDLLCEAVEIRIFDDISLSELSKILTYADNTTIRGIEILMRYSHNDNILLVKDFLKKFKRILKITFHSADDSFILDYDSQIILYTREDITSESHCGIVNTDIFKSNLKLFSEAINHNSCLNKKISIDKRGFVKNCPSMLEHFGHIDDVLLKDVLNDTSFTKLWNINKDQIDICNACEFRYICTDCRAYTNEKKTYGKPTKCSYNPYEAKWL